MSDEQELTFPDLPVGQWWKLRNFFKSNLPKTINVDYLMSTLKISRSTAANTYRNLGILGIIDKDGKLLDRANDWRSDDLYPQVCKQIAVEIYPTELLDIAEASKDRETFVGWFTRKTRIGEKAAHKNAAIFEVIQEGKLQNVKETKDGKGQAKPKSRMKRQNGPSKLAAPTTAIWESPSSQNEIPKVRVNYQPEKPLLPDIPLSPSIHIDIQIHLAPDAPTKQIEDIFTAIETHLYKPRSGE